MLYRIPLSIFKCWNPVQFPIILSLKPVLNVNYLAKHVLDFLKEFVYHISKINFGRLIFGWIFQNWNAILYFEFVIYTTHFQEDYLKNNVAYDIIGRLQMLKCHILYFKNEGCYILTSRVPRKLISEIPQYCLGYREH